MNRLVLRVEEIPPEGMIFELEPDPDLYGIEEVKVKNPPGLYGLINFSRRKEYVIVKGKIEAQLIVPCSRCLGRAEKSVSGDFFFRLLPEGGLNDSEEVELHRGELDVDFFSGGEIDIGRIIAEQVYLNLPIKVLCRPDCRGLCPRCGQDLNVEGCGHGQEKSDPRWNVLKSLKKK